MLVTLTCPNCGRGIGGVPYPLFGDMEADCPACGLHVEVPGDRLESLVSFALTADEPASSPGDGDWNPCDMACPGCEEVGHVFYRIFHASDLAVGGWRRDFHYECRGCGHAWWVGGEAP